MPYTKTTWSDRVVAKPLTYTLRNNGDGTTTLIPAEGQITSSGTAINAVTMNNLETQYDKAMTDVAALYLKLTGAQTLSGDLTISVGADTTPFTLINDNGQLVFVADTTDNSIQSLIGNGTASRNFTIEGLNGTNVSNFNVRADTTNLYGTLNLTVGGLLSTLTSSALTHFTFKKATFKSWTLQQSATGDLAFYPSTTADGTTWDTSNVFTIKSDGTFNAKTFVENGVLLTNKYAQLGVANTFTVGQTISSGSLTINEGTLVVGSVTNDCKIRMNSTSGSNWIQSGNQASAAKNLTISGYNASTLANMDILATSVKISGNQVQTSGHIQSGMVSITPVANTPTSAHVTFPIPYTAPPIVTVSAISGVPGTQVLMVSVSNITATGCDVYIDRNNTNSTNVNWIAQGTI